MAFSFGKTFHFKNLTVNQFCKDSFFNRKFYSAKCIVPKQPKHTAPMIQKDLLQNRTCFISNCENSENNNLPTQVAVSLANYGANVIVHGKEKNYLDHLKTILPVHDNTQKHFVVSGDLNDFQNSSLIASKVCDFTDKLDVLVHNAGLIFTNYIWGSQLIVIYL